MRKLCPNTYRDDALATVLEVPVPEETFTSTNINNKHASRSQYWPRMKSCIMFRSKAGTDDRSMSPLPPSAIPTVEQKAEIHLMLAVVGAPLLPCPTTSSEDDCRIKHCSIEASMMAKYIVQQYVAAAGGEKVIDAVESMCTVGKVRLSASECCTAEEGSPDAAAKGGGCVWREFVGGFVLWQKKRPEVWCLELLVSGCKFSAGNDGYVAWRQSPTSASRGAPRPLRRSVQGLDPRSTANLFSTAIYVGEKIINGEDWFILKFEAQSSSLVARSSRNLEILRHAVWGYFSQRTGLLGHLEDSHLLRIRCPQNKTVLWETAMETSIQDYRTVDGVNIAHSGRTAVSLLRFGDSTERHSRMRMEEAWTIEEVHFNIKGLSMECFLPPS